MQTKYCVWRKAANEDSGEYYKRLGRIIEAYTLHHPRFQLRIATHNVDDPAQA